MFFNILEVGHYFASPNRCSCAVFYGVVCIYTQMCGGLQTSSSSVFVAQFWLECGPNNFLLQKIAIVKQRRKLLCVKKSLKHRTGEASRLQALSTQPPQSPLQLVWNSQTPDGAIALASLLDNSKLLKKTTGATGSNNSLKKISSVWKTARKRLYLGIYTQKLNDLTKSHNNKQR